MLLAIAQKSPDDCNLCCAARLTCVVRCVGTECETCVCGSTVGQARSSPLHDTGVKRQSSFRRSTYGHGNRHEPMANHRLRLNQHLLRLGQGDDLGHRDVEPGPSPLHHVRCAGPPAPRFMRCLSPASAPGHGLGRLGLATKLADEIDVFSFFGLAAPICRWPDFGRRNQRSGRCPRWCPWRS